MFLVFSSYTEISNFLQGFVDNEANLNSAASCAGVCSDYRKTSHFQCQSGSLCDAHVNDHEQAKCTGIIRDCQDIDDSDVNICETVSGCSLVHPVSSCWYNIMHNMPANVLYPIINPFVVFTNAIFMQGEPNRRYNYIKYSDGRIAGNTNSNTVCHGRLRVKYWH